MRRRFEVKGYDLADAARGGIADCTEVPWAGVVHVMANHVIEPAPGGASGKVR